MGALTAAFSLASVFGVPLGIYLATMFSWHAPFVLAGGLAIVINGLAMKFVPSISGHIQEKVQTKPGFLTSISGRPQPAMGYSAGRGHDAGTFQYHPFHRYLFGAECRFHRT